MNVHDKTPDLIEGHDQAGTAHWIAHVPPHEPREHDPHYHLFHAAKERLRRLGLLTCAIPGCTFPGPMELHHTHVEFSLAGGVDLALASKAFGHHFADDDEFAAWMESPGNLEVLCPVHHRTHLGVHVLPGPLWEPLRVWRHSAAPPAEVVTAKDVSEHGN
ncbi:hypothetical protein [Streptomyces sp. NPDC057910]|uniref:hypothetical protein n=1 Tax=Streptomyces sp. NPDC057910 TaxID=3346278 RepID=UPI0036EB3335